MAKAFEYDAKVDSRKRVTLKEAEYEHYHVTVHTDGRIVLEPRVLAEPPTISRRTLAMLDRAVVELDAGRVSESVDPDEILSPKPR